MIIKLDTILPFGKHEGKQFEDVCIDYPDYVTWLAESEFHEFDEEAYEYMARLGII